VVGQHGKAARRTQSGKLIGCKQESLKEHNYQNQDCLLDLYQGLMLNSKW